MSRSEWLRTFVAVYRSGSVTAGARLRGLSQPAASQHLAALSKAAGGPVLARTAAGVAPTARGRELYGQVAESLDRLEGVLAGLDGGRLRADAPPVRIGASAELFEAWLLPALAPVDVPLVAAFGSDPEMLELLVAGDTDITVTTSPPPKRPGLDTVAVGERTYVLVAAPALVPDPLPQNVAALADALTGKPWVSYSHELPLTRKLWTSHLGRPFHARLRLVAPDLRAVAAAAAHGLGISLLPAYVCAGAITAGRLVEIFDVAGLLPPETWFATTRRADNADHRLSAVLDALRLPSAPEVPR